MIAVDEKQGGECSVKEQMKLLSGRIITYGNNIE